MSKLKIKNVYEGDIYYWGEKSVQDFLKKELSDYCLNVWKVYGDMVEINFTDMKGTYIFSKYDKSKLAILRQNSEQNEDRISNIVFNSSIEDIDISMCKYGMKRLSEVKKIYFLFVSTGIECYFIPKSWINLVFSDLGIKALSGFHKIQEICL